MSELTNAIDTITASVANCQYLIGALGDPNNPANNDYAEVHYYSGDNAYYTLFIHGAGCPTPASWDYADTTQTSIVLCPSACALVQADPEARMEIHYRCVSDA